MAQAQTLEEIVKSGQKLTPMMEQYYKIKKNYSDHLLLFRMGDFYEVFFEDATETSKVINIALTHRGKLGDTKIPMAGIPHHAASTYIDRMTSQGYRVAICEQVENPKDAKGIVKRAVTQTVSPGIPYDLEKTSHHQYYLASAIQDDLGYYLCALDFTTGEFKGKRLLDKDSFLAELQLLQPKELITFMGQWDHFPEVDQIVKQFDILRTHLSEDYFDSEITKSYIEKLIPRFHQDETLNSNAHILAPIGALSYYIISTQQLENLYHIKPFQMVNNSSYMKLSLSTLVGLEILPKSKERYKESLLGFMDKTCSAMGARKLKKTFLSPLCDIETIKSRQEFITYLIENFDQLEEIRTQLSQLRDIERILAKASTGKIIASDLLNIARAVEIYKESLSIIKKAPHQMISPLVTKEKTSLTKISDLVLKTINDEIGASLEKGNLINKGVHKKRDSLASSNQTVSKRLEKLEEKYRQETGIQKLRVKSNNVAGFFIEVSKVHSNKVPKEFDRKQTLVNSERYVTSELNELEKDILSAKGKLEQVERGIFQDLVNQINENSLSFINLAESLSLLDTFQSLSWVSLQEDFTCPKLFKDKKIIETKGAWHPLIKSVIRDKFISHDILLDKNKYFGLITGPNMAGKTTVMREIAIIQLLAQLGTYVPSESSKLGICDYLFSRLGASDDIIKGQSTFMVEMTETAEILRHATEKSLIILDEVGRGTSTYDGLSIAWALVEHFVEQTKSITLFATHYHELIELADSLPHAKNLTVETLNKGEDVQFLYKLIEKGASQSFGIYVAKLAGLPKTILGRAKEKLQGLEQTHTVPDSSAKESIKKTNNKTQQTNQLSFFPEENPQLENLEKLEKELRSLDLMNTTPLKALEILDKLKKMAARQK